MSVIINENNFQIKAKKINFYFENKKLEAYEGETISSALIRNGYKKFRIDKEGNDRGVYCNMGVCNECILNVNGNPSIKSCSTKVINDDKIFRQNYQAPIPDTKEEIQLNKEIKETEILLIGSGPSGMGFLNSIKNSNQKITIIDEKDSIGGQYYKKLSDIFDLSKNDKFDHQQTEGLDLEQKLKSENFEFLLKTKVWGIFQKEDDFYEVCCSKNNQDIRIITKKIIVATGSFEKPYFIEGWHLPGVMTTGGAQIMSKTQGIFLGKDVVITGNGPLNFQLASELMKNNINVKAVVETSGKPFTKIFSSLACLISSPLIFLQGISSYLKIYFSKTNIFHDSALVKIENESNKKKIVLKNIKNNNFFTLSNVDVVCLNYGFIPNNDIGKILGLEGSFNKEKNFFEIKKNLYNETSKKNIFFIGEAARNSGAKISLHEGELTGFNLNNKKSLFDYFKFGFSVFNLFRSILFQFFLWKIFEKNISNSNFITGETLFCRCENVKFNEVKKLKDQKNIDVGLIKRITRTGMGRCQGRYCGYGLSEIFKDKITDLNYKQYSFAPQNPIQTVEIKNTSYEKEEWYGYVQDKLPNFNIKKNKNKSKVNHKIAVIGGGIMGVSTTYNLLKHEKNVCLIDRLQPNSQASGSNAGSLHVQLLSYDFDPNNLSQLDNMKTLLKLQKKAVLEWKDIEHDTKSNFEISYDGGLMFAENEKDLEKLNMKIEVEQSVGVNSQLINQDQIQKINPLFSNKMIYAGYCPSEGKINPLKATNSIFENCKQNGLTAYCDDLIHAIEKKSGKFIIITDNHEIEVDKVVNCAGSWANNIASFLDLPLKVKSVPQQMIVTEALEYKLKLLVAHIGRHLTLKQATNGNFIIGGGWTANYSKNTDHLHALKDSFEGNTWVAKRVIPNLSNVNILRSWAAMSVDVGGYPLMGEHPLMKDFYTLVSSNGYTLGPTLGKILCQQIIYDKVEYNLFDKNRLN